LTIASSIQTIYQHRHLIWVMTKREVVGRYRGSIMGILWSFFNPVFMLTIYTFVFSVVFKAKWGAGSNSKAEFAMILFAGLIVFNLFSETVTRAPTLILSNVNYVKKVVFPLEILPVVSILSSCFHTLVSIGVLILFRLIVGSGFSLTTVLFPFIIAPLLFLSLGISWFLAALGVYLRDVSQTIGLIMTALMFLSPIFFPITALPEKYRIFVYLNPLSFIIEQGREVLIFSRLPDWGGLLIYYAFGFFTALLGYTWFQKTRTGFADVL
jgi:lipopolysaccharide transport system permease protein